MINFSPFLKKALLSEDLHKAYHFAYRAHEGQERQGGQAYIEHPLAVAALLSEHCSPVFDPMVVAALLHDVVEDTEHTLEDILREFGDPVWGIVGYLTDPEREPFESRNQYYKRIHSRWPHFSWEAKMVKLADRLHNLMSLTDSVWEDWQKEQYAEQALKMVAVFDLKEPVKLADLVMAEALKWIDNATDRKGV